MRTWPSTARRLFPLLVVASCSGMPPAEPRSWNVNYGEAISVGKGGFVVNSRGRVVSQVGDAPVFPNCLTLRRDELARLDGVVRDIIRTFGEVERIWHSYCEDAVSFNINIGWTSEFHGEKSASYSFDDCSKADADSRVLELFGYLEAIHDSLHTECR